MFNVNTPFWRFLNKMADQFILSLLWIICMLPLFTAGASTAAFFSVSMDLQMDKEGAIVRCFFLEFKRLFRRAGIFELFHLPIMLFVIYDLWLLYKMLDPVSLFLLPIFFMAAILISLSGAYGYALIGRSSQGIGEIWKTAFGILFTYLPHSFVMVVLGMIGFLALSIPYAAIIAPAMVVYQYARIFNWIFEKEKKR